MLLKRSFVCLLAVCVVSISFTGCRSRNNCQQQFPQQFQQQQFPQQFPQQFQPQQFQQFPQNFQQFPQQQFSNQFGFNSAANSQFNTAARRSPVIPAPPTGSLNIPSLARNNPFGVNRGLLNTGQAAPTPANRSASSSSSFNRQNGWQPVGSSQSGQRQSNPSQQNNSGTSLSSNSRSLVPTQGNSSNAPAAARSVLAQGSQSNVGSQSNIGGGYGDSFVRSQDYATTTVNETFDRTRLPATDASGVRAPSQYYARASGAQVAQVPSQGTFGAPQQRFFGNNQQAFNGSGTRFPVNNQAAFNNQLAFNSQAAFNASGSGTRQVGVFAANSGAVVQGQSTTTYDPYDNTRSADWRNRDSSNSFQ